MTSLIDYYGSIEQESLESFLKFFKIFSRSRRCSRIQERIKYILFAHEGQTIEINQLIDRVQNFYRRRKNSAERSQTFIHDSATVHKKFFGVDNLELKSFIKKGHLLFKNEIYSKFVELIKQNREFDLGATFFVIHNSLNKKPTLSHLQLLLAFLESWAGPTLLTKKDLNQVNDHYRLHFHKIYSLFGLEKNYFGFKTGFKFKSEVIESNCPIFRLNSPTYQLINNFRMVIKAGEFLEDDYSPYSIVEGG